jgi:hypothetical protein
MKIPCGKNNLTLMASSWGEIGDRLQVAQQILVGDFKRVAQEQLPSKLATDASFPRATGSYSGGGE